MSRVYLHIQPLLVDSSAPSLDAVDRADTIRVPEREDELADDVVEARAEAAARDNGCADSRRVEERRRARAGAQERASDGALVELAHNVRDDDV